MITLKTLPQATEQEVFDHVSKHLLKQGERSRDESGGCLYRHEDLKCAAGCLIGDDEYDPNIEGFTWETLSRKKFPKNHADLIETLQFIHDAEPVKNWRSQLEKLAAVKNLKCNL